GGTAQWLIREVVAGCRYHNKVYGVGQLVAVLPQLCINLYCRVKNPTTQEPLATSLEVGRPGEPDAGEALRRGLLQLPTIVPYIVDEGCGCCMKDGLMYENGYDDIHLDEGCTHYTCINSTWVKGDRCASSNTTECIEEEEGKKYRAGEVMRMGREEHNGNKYCIRKVCQGDKTKEKTLGC
ncbi:hypothetical protein Hamer_G017358, partial [Homarus americanus]